MPRMTRVLLFVAGIFLLAVTALGVLWLAGQVLVGVGAVLAGAAGALLRLLWFLALAGVVGGLTYFVSNAWRPGRRVASAFAAVPAPKARRPERRVAAPASLTASAPLVVAAQSEIVREAASASAAPASPPPPTDEERERAG